MAGRDAGAADTSAHAGAAVSGLFKHLPNLLTGLRLASAPAVALLLIGGNDRAALGIFALAGLSDAADGFLAKLLGNGFEFVIAVLAAARIGVIVVPMSTRQRAPETEFILTQCEAVALIYQGELAEHLPARDALPHLRECFVVGDGPGTPFPELTRSCSAPPVTIAEEDIFALLYTLIYLLLTLEDNALLVGAIASFVAVAAAMYLTRRIDWYSSLPGIGASEQNRSMAPGNSA